MKHTTLIAIVLQLTVLTVMSCNYASAKEKKEHLNFLITNDGVSEFKLNSDIEKYDLSKYENVVDTSAILSEDEVDLTPGKIIYFNKDQFLVLWLYENKITEIDIKTDGFSTKDGYKVGMCFEALFKKIQGNYNFNCDYFFTFSLPIRNIIFLISNSYFDIFSDSEINDIYNNTLSIQSNQLEKMSVESIIVTDLDYKAIR